jgi:endogenous inhibitor of DNA gyrase (YacG/DUF329 family)
MIMNTKAVHNGYCLNCGRESIKPFCKRKCYLDYIRKGLPFSEKEYEKQQRNLLTDRIVKRGIYIASKGSIKYNQMTPEMIVAKRESVLVYRVRREEIKTNPPVSRDMRCVVCGEKIITGNSNRTTCSDECSKEKAKQRDLKRNMVKKGTKERTCKQCGKKFVPIYGDKKRSFCSKRCAKHNQSGQNDRKKARKHGVAYEYINARKVCERDGWHCQICGKATPKNRRGSCYPNAPEIDHRIPISKGGPHLYSNVQCACRICNGKKSNRNSVGQLPLFNIQVSRIEPQIETFEDQLIDSKKRMRGFNKCPYCGRYLYDNTCLCGR